MRCNKCPNCIKLETEKRLALMHTQPYSLVGGRLQVNTNPPAFDNEAWNKTLASLPCWSEPKHITVSQVKVGDVLYPFDKIEWKHWEGDDKPLTVKIKGGRTRLFTLTDEQGKEYRASGQCLTYYSHTVVVRNGKFIGKFFCKYWQEVLMPNLTKQGNWYRWWLRNFPLADVEILEYSDGSAHLCIRNTQGDTLRQAFGSFKVCERYFLRQWAVKNFALTLFYDDGRINVFPSMNNYCFDAEQVIEIEAPNRVGPNHRLNTA